MQDANFMNEVHDFDTLVPTFLRIIKHIDVGHPRDKLQKESTGRQLIMLEIAETSLMVGCAPELEVHIFNGTVEPWNITFFTKAMLAQPSICCVFPVVRGGKGPLFRSPSSMWYCAIVSYSRSFFLYLSSTYHLHNILFTSDQHQIDN